MYTVLIVSLGLIKINSSEIAESPWVLGLEKEIGDIEVVDLKREGVMTGFFFFFLSFLGLLLWHVEFPRLGVYSEL